MRVWRFAFMVVVRFLGWQILLTFWLSSMKRFWSFGR